MIFIPSPFLASHQQPPHTESSSSSSSEPHCDDSTLLSILNVELEVNRKENEELKDKLAATQSELDEERRKGKNQGNGNERQIEDLQHG